MAHLSIPGVTGEWQWDEGDPEEIYFLEEEIASGSFGTVYVDTLCTQLTLSTGTKPDTTPLANLQP